MAVRIAMFKDPKDYIEWMEGEIDLLRRNGLKFAEQQLADAVSGKSRKGWFEMNSWCKPENQDAVWAKQIEWCAGNVKYLRRRIRKYENEIRKVKAEYGIA